MSTGEIITMVSSLCGGIALFLFGLNVMGTGLEKLAGSKLETILAKLTSNIFSCVFLGIVVTAVMQSSSATTVMVVGFVNSGLMKLKKSIGVIMGANIGTTVTAWLMSLMGIQSDNVFMNLMNPSNFAPIIGLAGVVMYLFIKKEKTTTLGQIFVGLSVLFIGMELMTKAVNPLSDLPAFKELIARCSNPLLGILVGTIITVIIQSSAASVGILQAVSSTGALNIAAALPIIMGQNIGTCVKTILAGVGAKKNAKRAAVIHFYFNLIGTVIFLLGFYLLKGFLTSKLGFDFTGAANATSIALVHTTFNVTTVLLLLPFVGLLEKLAILTIPDKKDSVEDIGDTLDERFLKTPSYALEQCRITTIRVAELAVNNVKEALGLFYKYDDQIAKNIFEVEDNVDHYEDRLENYIVRLTDLDISANESQLVSKILHAINDLERICDHSVNLAEIAMRKKEKNVHFSADAKFEIDTIVKAISDIMDYTLECYESDDLEASQRVEPLEEVIDIINDLLKDKHIERLKTGQCNVESGVILLDLLQNIERIADHCSNIAVCVSQHLDSHEYLKGMHTEKSEDYSRLFEEYKTKYYLPIS